MPSVQPSLKSGNYTIRSYSYILASRWDSEYVMTVLEIFVLLLCFSDSLQFPIINGGDNCLTDGRTAVNLYTCKESRGKVEYLLLCR